MVKLLYKISNVHDGNMSYRHGEKEEVLENRKLFLKKLNLSLEDTVAMRVEMKDRIMDVSEEDKRKGIFTIDDAVHCDALITKEKNLGLFLTIADCLPVILFDSKNEILSLVHCGWPNTDLKILPKVIKKMIKEFETEIPDLEVIIGPGIQKDSLIYDENIFNLITTDWGKYIQKEDEGYHIENLGFTLQQLEDLGIKKEQISIDTTDTCTSDEYFSHVRDYKLNQPDQGRFCTVVYMKG